MPLASPSIIAAFSGPHVCTLSGLIQEYELEGMAVLEACLKIVAVLAAFNVDMDPPVGVLGLEDTRVLKQRKETAQAAARVRRLIEGGENAQTEFKASIAINTRKRLELPDAPLKECVDERLRHKAAQEIAAFLNADGGVMLFGVTDDGQIRGCEEDFSVFEKGGGPGDKADLILRQLIDKCFRDADPVFYHTQVECVELEGKHVVAVSIAPRDKLTFLKSNDPTPLYVRSGSHALPVTFDMIEDFYFLRRR